jgi:hypothetical protein
MSQVVKREAWLRSKNLEHAAKSTLNGVLRHGARTVFIADHERMLAFCGVHLEDSPQNRMEISVDGNTFCLPLLYLLGIR